MLAIKTVENDYVIDPVQKFRTKRSFQSTLNDIFCQILCCFLSCFCSKPNTSKTVIKEIRFGPNTDEHDFEFKVKHAQKFLDEGSKVKAYVHFRGRTIVFKERGELLLLKLLKEVEDYGAAEALPKMEGRRMIVILAPKKKK